MLKISIFAFIFFLYMCGCCGITHPSSGGLEAFIIKHAKTGIVNVTAERGIVTAQVLDGDCEVFEVAEDTEIYREITGEITSRWTTNCFGYDWCLRFDATDTSRGIYQESTAQFVLYGEVDADEPPTGVTYTNNINYGPFFHSTAPTHTTIRAAIVVYGEGLPVKRQQYCNSQPLKCWEEQFPP